jgi:hypothetical protein
MSLKKYSYKILTKIIANCLKTFLPKIISENHDGFLKDKQITNNIVLVQEATHSNKKCKSPGMVIKHDMENDFNHVNHSFLLSVLKDYIFSYIFISSIRSCIDTPWIYPLINGWPSQFFNATRGIHQGCPLSPFLYILLADPLGWNLE